MFKRSNRKFYYLRFTPEELIILREALTEPGVVKYHKNHHFREVYYQIEQRSREAKLLKRNQYPRPYQPPPRKDDWPFDPDLTKPF